MSGKGMSPQVMRQFEAAIAQLKPGDLEEHRSRERSSARNAGMVAIKHEPGTDTIKESWSKSIDTKKLDTLIGSVGWDIRGDEKWQEILNKSAAAISLWDGDRLVAFARMVEDGNSCMLYDGVVAPDYQQRGLMSQMMTGAFARIEGKNYSHVGLVAAPGTEDMYRHLGWERAGNVMTLIPEDQLTVPSTVSASVETSPKLVLSERSNEELVSILGQITAELASRNI